MRHLKRGVKQLWQALPYAPEVEWYLLHRQKLTGLGRLRKLNQAIHEWKVQIGSLSPYASPGRKVLLFSMIHIWLRHSACLGMAFSGMGHQVSLAYLPYDDWFTDENNYRLRLKNSQLKTALTPGADRIELLPWFDHKPATELPAALAEKIESLSIRDYQYTRQVEEVDESDCLLHLRRQRNRFAAAVAYERMSQHRPDVVLIPNGLILEFGAVYEVARYLDIPAVTYEFGEQHDRIWLAQNQPVMFQDTTVLWENSKNKPFTAEMRQKVEELYASRREAGLWQNFSRQWQDIPTQGGQAVRALLGLDERPVVLLAANVIGDSLTLGRQVFTDSMTEWIGRTLDYFIDKTNVQFVLRIHPGERYTDGPSVEDIVRQRLPDVPAHFRIIAAQDPVNTYDLISIASLGMVYTTTVGMEMSMYGVPTVVVGRTHYRQKGFTLDPESWDAFFALLDQALIDLPGAKLTQAQIDMAWQYAYSFFFEYPQTFPWHLRRLFLDVKERPIDKVLAPEGMQQYGVVFDTLLGNSPV